LSNASPGSITRAFALADGAFGLNELATRIAALDLKIPAAMQNAMMADIAELLRRLGHWFIVNLPATIQMAEAVATYRAGFGALKGRFSGLVSPLEARTVETRIAAFVQAKVPTDVAEDLAVLPLLASAPEIVLLSETDKLAVDSAAQAYFNIGAIMGLDRLRARAAEIVSVDHWDRLALRRIVDDLYTAQRLLAGDAVQRANKNGAAKIDGSAAAKSWAKLRGPEVERTANFLAELERGGEPSIAKLALANSQIQKLAADCSKTV